MNILKKAYEIAYNRSEEKERQYGDYQKSMKIAADIASSISGKSFTPDDIYISMIAVKLSREANCHKEDNLLDLVAYISRLNDLRNEKI